MGDLAHCVQFLSWDEGDASGPTSASRCSEHLLTIVGHGCPVRLSRSGSARRGGRGTSRGRSACRLGMPALALPSEATKKMVLSADCGGTTTRLMLYRVSPDASIERKQRAPGPRARARRGRESDVWGAATARGGRFPELGCGREPAMRRSRMPRSQADPAQGHCRLAERCVVHGQDDRRL